MPRRAECMRLVPACLVDFLLTEVCLKHDRSSASGGTEILPGREVVRGATARRPPPWSSSPTSCQRQACCHGGPSGRVGHGLPARTGMTARPIDVRLVDDPVTPYVRTRLLSCGPCHLSAETNVALLQGGARCHDTDDTNRGSGDTRAIRWTVRIALSETFQMSLISCPDCASSVANENCGTCNRASQGCCRFN
jgi:hypothetical protein